MHLRGKTYIARHGETVFNASARLQGEHPHTPLTRTGFAQANAMGLALRDRLGARPALTLWSSTAGRALQTLAIITEHLDLDWFAARTDDRLVEIGVGSWGGRNYADLTAEVGPIVDRATMLLKPAPDGERYHQIAARVAAWAMAADREDPGDRLVIMHGVSSRVLRGVLTGLPNDPSLDAPVARGLPQGSIVMIENGTETLVVEGTGGAPA